MEESTSITGRGAKGIVNGTTYYIGSPKLFKELNVFDFGLWLENNEKTWQNQGEKQP
ncbi:hypothetical protein [Staphylococcus aureus]